MRYLSVCSGIEAASVAWHPLGWTPVGFAEIEPFPCSVLAHRFPDVPNYGDMTTIAARIDSGEIEAPDILVGGTPCQAFSVAGKRGSLSDPRGQLTMAFLDIVRAGRPKWVVWENVPGVLSSDGDPLALFLDSLQDLGYTVNCDILDAQFFGVAQRRRRVFVTCQRADILMRERTTTSALIGAALVAEIFVAILDAHTTGFAREQENLDASCVGVGDGLRRKIAPFLRHGDKLWKAWLLHLAESSASALPAPACSGSNRGRGTETATHTASGVGMSLSGSSQDRGQSSKGEPSTSTLRLLLKSLEDLFATARLFTTSTGSKTTTDHQICSYAETIHAIAAFITRSDRSSPHWLKAASSVSTAIQNATNYARLANGGLFQDERVLRRWDDLIREAERLRESVASAGAFDPGAVLLEWEGVRRDSAPSREAREGTAADAGRCASVGGWPAEVAPTLNAAFGDKMGLEDQHALNGAGCFVPVGSHWDSASNAHPTLNQSTSSSGGTNTAGPKVLDTTAAARYDPLYAYATQAGPIEALRLLLRSVDEETGARWGLGILASFWPEAVLRANLHGTGVRCEGFSFRGCVHLSLPRKETCTERTMLRLWEAGCAGCPPQGWGLHEQHAVQLAAYLSGLPYSPAPFQRLMLCMREASEGLRVLLHALSAVQEAWRSACNKGEPAHTDCDGGRSHQAMQVRRLCVMETEALQGFPRGWTLVPHRGKPAADGPRYKAIGNSMAVNVMAWIGSRIDRHARGDI